jgi:hypothetical protein
LDMLLGGVDRPSGAGGGFRVRLTPSQSVTQITRGWDAQKGRHDVNSFELIERRQAPVLATAWWLLRRVLEDGRWHPGSELLAASSGGGVPVAATRALLTTAVHTGRVQVAGRGGVPQFRLGRAVSGP